MEFQDANPGSASTTPSAGGGSGTLEAEIQVVGGALLSSLKDVVGAVASPSAGPQALARGLGLDKVLASRILKATRSGDPMAATHAMPGPDPLRRLVRAAARKGVPTEVTGRAMRAIDDFEILIRDRIGDRSLLDAIVSAWVPDARREFELRRKQAAFKALSQLKGVQADSILATVILHPSADGEHIDVVWVNGLFGLHRVRPGAGVKLTTRRVSGADGARRPVSLDGRPVDDLDGLLLRDFCSQPLPRLGVHHAGEVVHYTLGGDGFGSGASVDVVFAEANRAELVRYFPAGTERKSYFFAEVVPPSHRLQFDVLAHESLYPGQAPGLVVYDTAFEGVASPNNPGRDIDRLDLIESVEDLGKGAQRFRSAEIPRYAELVGYVLDRMGWDGSCFRGYRCGIDYPVYGSQVTMTFRPAMRQGDAGSGTAAS